MGLLFIHSSATHGVRGVHGRSVEDCNVENLSVEELHAQYTQLKADLNNEIERFESEKKKHHRRVQFLTESLTKKWFEYQLAKQERKK